VNLTVLNFIAADYHFSFDPGFWIILNNTYMMTRIPEGVGKHVLLQARTPHDDGQ
jgi:hypothetical protein